METLSLNNLNPLKQISSNNISKIYQVAKEDGSIAVVKKVSLPISDDDAATLMEKGKILFLQDATNYYLQLLNNEIEVLKQLSEEKNILHIYDTFQDKQDEKDNYYIIMEYADDITTYFKKNGISEQDIVKLGIDICTAIEVCQKINVLHNDIKPANIFFDGTNYKLGDFGNSTNGSSDNIVYFGSPNYLSPEVYNERPTTVASDIYSLGIVLYQLLAGHFPFVNEKTNEKEALTMRMSGAALSVIDDVNPLLMSAIIKACNFDINNRYQSASELKSDLEKIQNLSSEKKKIIFDNSKMSDTISVFDSDLIARQGKITHEIALQKKKTKAKIFFKKWFKKITAVVLLLALLLTCYIVYSFNKECDLGYINQNGVCKKGYYYCETGYVLNEKNECQKTIKSIDAKVSYSCKSGFTYTNETCVSNEIQEPTFTYQCLDGFTLNGTKCEKTETNDAVITYTCPKGYANMNGVCVKGDEKDASVSYSCPSGYTKGPFQENGEYKCSKYITSSSSVDANVKYSCPTGYTLDGTKCTKVTNDVSKSSCSGTTSNEKCTYNNSWCAYYPYGMGCTQNCTYTCTVTIDATKNYSCDSGGTLNGSKCTFTGGNTIKVKATATYTCPKGYEKIGTKCIYGDQKNGTPVYTCLDSQTLKGDKCYTTITTDAVGMYTCPTGFVASGITCIQDEFPQPLSKYSCSRIYTLNGDKCEQYETKPAKAIFTE